MTSNYSIQSEKCSGIPWAGKVPAHWQLKRAKFLFTLARRVPESDDGIVTAFRDGQVTLRSNRRTDGFTNALKEAGYQGVRKGDLVIHAMDAFAGAIGVSDSDGKCTPVYSCCVPNAGVSSEYYARCVRTMATSGYIESLARGIRERSTDFRWATFAEELLPVPPEEEQKAIVNFLDRATAQMDILVTKKAKLIELLREKRQALITHAVTKGLDPGAKTKDCGVAWLGHLPETWLLGRFKHAGRFETGIDHKHLASGDVPVYGSSECPFGFVNARIATGPAIAIGRKGTIDKPFVINGDFWAVDTCMFNRVASPEFELKYCFYLSTIVPWVNYSTKTALPSLTQTVVDNVPMPRPPLSEQRQIVQHLDRAITPIDRLITKTQRSIDLLREHRTALITAAVTGKIDMTNAS